MGIMKPPNPKAGGVVRGALEPGLLHPEGDGTGEAPLAQGGFSRLAGVSRVRAAALDARVALKGAAVLGEGFLLVLDAADAHVVSSVRWPGPIPNQQK